jgi:FkbM family methyltransferase
MSSTCDSRAVSGLARVACSVVGVLSIGIAASCRPQPPQTPPPPANRVLLQHVSTELLRAANHGRDIFRPDGYFDFPKRVKAVWVDVGAHRLETTQLAWKADSRIGLVAIEPQAQCWPTWPESRRLAGIPAAIFVERGTMDFHVNRSDLLSSLLPSGTGTDRDAKLATVEVRKVPVVRLEDVLTAIPADLNIEYLKVDVQGADLQVIQSAGELLRRVGRVRVEITNVPYYHDLARTKQGTESETTSYMKKMGFRFASEIVHQERDWLDMDFINTQREATSAGKS